VLLPRFVGDLKQQGLDRVNISLDSLDARRYRVLTRGGSLEAALSGVEAALQFDLSPVKLNVVLMPELLAELPGFVALTRDRALHVRFIEWMPVGGCGPRSAGETLSKDQVMAALGELGADGPGPLEPVPSPGGWGPAHYYRFPGHQGTLGFIGSVSDHFCGECDRRRFRVAESGPRGGAGGHRGIAGVQELRQERAAGSHGPGDVPSGRLTWASLA
jgi:cyclic pyranopterin phosphate synthase